ncbi:MAG TPA: protein kinase, partial [Myxococcota bacterium]|nr:protein kinase [Myxococcota bacterium]
HQAGVVHRDFKLENVLIGTDGVPRVTDFGLARVGQPEPTIHADFSRDGPSSSLAGTPGYMAPELRTGAPATEKSDQYSFFVALRLALQGVSGTEPRALAALIRQGTATSPAQRLADMSSVITALEAILAPRILPDQRAREVLIERVQRLWVDPVRARVAQVHGRELPLRCEVIPSSRAPKLDLGEGTAEDIATALHTLQAWVVLTGAPGAGKSQRLLGVAEVLLQRARNGADGLLPVVLNLSSFPVFSGSFFEWLLHELVAKVALPRDQVRRWLEDGQLALLLDGLDEVAGPARARCAEALNQLRAERPMPALVTCREDTFRGLLPALLCDTVLRLCPLEVPALMERIAAPTMPPGVLRMVEGDAALVEQLRNPLLLALFTQVAGDFAASVPDAAVLRERLYPLALGHALDRAPELKGEQRAGTTAGVRWLAAAMVRAGVTELWLEEMQASWLPNRAQRVAAYGLGMGAAYRLSIAINLMAARVAQQPWYSGLFFGIIAVTAAFVIQGGLRVVPMEA